MNDERAPGSAHRDSDDPVLAGRRVIVALTGGVACYKTAELVSRLVQAGALVRVLMTEAATRFVTPLTFASLSNAPVATSIWEHQGEPSAPHIALARWCDLLIVAPASADILAKLAAGICDDVVSLVAMTIGRRKPMLLAPAMNSDMWSHPITQRNLAVLQQLLGSHTIGPESGWQACRTEGPGRMSEAGSILNRATELLARDQNAPDGAG